MARIAWKIITDNGKSKWKNYYQRIKYQITFGSSGSTSVMNRLIEQIVLRSPDPETEKQLILYGTGGEPGTIQMTKKGKARNYFVAGRIRFIKEGSDQLFIREAVQDARTYDVVYGEGPIVGYKIGNFEMLNLLTKFTWVNATKGNKKRPAEQYTHVSEYGTFAAFEYGTMAIGWGEVLPKFGKTLVPTETLRMRDMYKNINPYYMYSGISKEYIRDLIAEEIRGVQY